MSLTPADLIGRVERQTDERGYEIDPNNPWPRGSDWWLMHNERYTRSRWWRQWSSLKARSA